MYQVALKMTDGTVSYLSTGQRTAWTLAVARKHKANVATKIAAGVWAHVRYATLIPA